MPEIIPIQDEGLGNHSYLVELGDHRALLLDPSRDPLPYLATAKQRGLTVAFSLETHLHADFISGSRELAFRGARVLAPAAGRLQHPHRGLEDREEVDLGGLTLQALATPGHTPEHLSYLLLDGKRPLALFSGGALLPGSAARTDLISAAETDSLTRELYRGVRERLFSLPDDLPVYPTHGAGSFCSAASSGEPWTTIGREKAANPIFASADEDEFVRAFLGSLGSYPDYFLRLREINRRGPRVYGARWPSLSPLSVEEVRRLVTQGAEVVDVRPYRDFAAGHIPGALSNTLREAFASWLGWVVPEAMRLVFVLNPDQDRAELVRQCLKVGYEDLAGELAGGLAAWQSAGLPTSTISLLSASQTVPGLALDVRQRSEYSVSRLPRAMHIELGSLKRAADALPAGPVMTYCGHGERAMMAASLLERAGRKDLAVLDGGIAAWQRLCRPVENDG
ncbi:MAG: MBL fold metallo-hydrolase [Candidatus Nephthysia bennettiae]|uniref:MBL fold metallo-hydrolase n=1 Tax=Candidatus Nephthysia bennettiae TaxID=3127016 RepID=A0A934KG73_9BACT|nr:MBL fold metallo-hydrolase [Candidatus Dormibacteraeota bacterium]PZR96566.1 MAG: MBL fold metallo-hydrolase [Candidatus Dormibacteraeota bacterium]